MFRCNHSRFWFASSMNITEKWFLPWFFKIFKKIKKFLTLFFRIVYIVAKVSTLLFYYEKMNYTVGTVYENVIKKHPNRIAIRMEDKKMTYQEVSRLCFLLKTVLFNKLSNFLDRRSKQSSRRVFLPRKLQEGRRSCSADGKSNGVFLYI